jgi:hypothetical protein
MTASGTTEERAHAGPAQGATTILRAGLVLLALSELLVGVRALPWPRAFFDAFPLPGHTWVAYFPPYNEHSVREVGAYSLAVGVMLGIAAWRPDPLLVRTTLIGFLLYSIPHTVFHALHLHGFRRPTPSRRPPGRSRSP